MFEGVAGSSFQGDIAIDDAELLDGRCPPPGDCDFEKGKCTWTNPLAGDQFDWVRASGATSSVNTGPANDHTKQDKTGSIYYDGSAGGGEQLP